MKLGSFCIGRHWVQHWPCHHVSKRHDEVCSTVTYQLKAWLSDARRQIMNDPQLRPHSCISLFDPVCTLIDNIFRRAAKAHLGAAQATANVHCYAAAVVCSGTPCEPSPQGYPASPPRGATGGPTLPPRSTMADSWPTTLALTAKPAASGEMSCRCSHFLSHASFRQNLIMHVKGSDGRSSLLHAKLRARYHTSCL